MPELDKALAALAVKLGTSVDHLWAVLIKQATISAWVEIFEYAALAFFVSIWVKYVPPNYKRWDNGYDVGAPVLAIASGALLGVMLVVAFCSVSGTVTKLCNAEYWALHEVLGALGK